MNKYTVLTIAVLSFAMLSCAILGEIFTVAEMYDVCYGSNTFNSACGSQINSNVQFMKATNDIANTEQHYGNTDLSDSSITIILIVAIGIVIGLIASYERIVNALTIRRMIVNNTSRINYIHGSNGFVIKKTLSANVHDVKLKSAFFLSIVLCRKSIFVTVGSASEGLALIAIRNAFCTLVKVLGLTVVCWCAIALIVVLVKLMSKVLLHYLRRYRIF